MAISKGFRFPVEFHQAFPQGLVLLGEVAQKTKYNPDRTALPEPVYDINKDGEGTGLPVWVASVTDPHEGQEGKAKRASFEIEFISSHQPVPATPEIVPGTGMRMIELEGLTAEPTVVRQGSGDKNFSYVSYKFRATGIKGDTNTPKATNGKAAA
ncbi:hypothetical protein [Nocardia paucivorans]|uniref:hypothetical protein n=1 Tax=Nocardia paucivorans TaxID=114259 RepID=UPI0002E69EDA|nr:hypothetical protein [Nocardia paucivorans]